MTTSRKHNPTSFVERQWKPFFQHVESGRVRRGKTAAKQGTVSHFVVSDGTISAKVKSEQFRGGTYQVRIPCVSWWKPYLDDVALWFARRPDWLAALLSGEWDESLLEFVDEAGIRLFPDEQAVERICQESVCNCLDWESPCKHVVTVVQHMVSHISLEPLYALTCVGIEPEALMDLVHATSVSMSEKGRGGQEQFNDERSTAQPWPEEELVYQIQEESVADVQRWLEIAPKFDLNKVQQWRRANVSDSSPMNASP